MKAWYAVHTKPRREGEADEQLQRQGFETYLPLIQVRRLRRGKRQAVIEPLFPRYLFVHVDPDEKSIAPIRSTRGVSGMVKFGHALVPIPGDLVDYLMSCEDPELGCHRPGRVDFQPGDRVQILEGPLTGLDGIFETEKGEDRAMILVSILGRASSVGIALEALERKEE